LDEKEYSNIYAIPANYTDSGKIFGGMLEPRNAVETGILLIILGYPELVLTLTLLPLAVLSMMGIDGDSLFQYIGHIIRYFASRRKLHYRRVGYRYDPKQLRKKKKGGKAKKKGKKTGKAGVRSGLHSS